MNRRLPFLDLVLAYNKHYRPDRGTLHGVRWAGFWQRHRDKGRQVHQGESELFRLSLKSLLRAALLRDLRHRVPPAK